MLFFYNGEKRKSFRRRHSVCGHLLAQGVLGRYSEINGTPFIPSRESRIGNFCSIAKNVSIGTGSHPVNTLTAHTIAFGSSGGDLKISASQQCKDFAPRKPVFIGHDVWIGTDVVILDGVNIGTGAVVGVNAVVTHDIPPYAIAVGIPAKVIRYRFDKNTISRILQDRPAETLCKLPFHEVEKCLEILENEPDI